MIDDELSSFPAKQSIILIPESSNDRVWAFDAFSGDLLDDDFIGSTGLLGTPQQAILHPDGTRFLVSDQGEDIVAEYSLDGSKGRTFAPSVGTSTTLMDNIRGIHVTDSGRILVSVASGGNQDSVVEVSSEGEVLGQFITAGSGGIDSPWGIDEKDGILYVGAFDSNNVHLYDADTGTSLGTLLDDIPEPERDSIEQVTVTTSGTVLVANFGGNSGVREYDTSGTLLATHTPGSLGGLRGNVDLGNGNFLATNGGGVYEVKDGVLLDTKATGPSFRLASRVDLFPALVITDPSTSPALNNDTVKVAEYAVDTSPTLEAATWVFENQGNAFLEISSISELSTFDVLSTPSAILDPGTSSTLSIAFPLGLPQGDYIEELQIVTNDDIFTTFTIQLFGDVNLGGNYWATLGDE
jgi:outer membrane protein assembly factor BamB